MLSQENSKNALIDENAYTTERIHYWNEKTEQMHKWKRIRNYYRQRLIEIYSFIVPKNVRVLELGCGQGDLLAALQPSYGVGIDFSSEMIGVAKSRHPHLNFIEMNAQHIDFTEPFDYIICSDLVNELYDVQAVFAALGAVCHPQTRFLLNFHSNLWQSPRNLATKIGIARPQMLQNWLAPDDIANLLYLTDFEIIRASNEVLCPVRIPFLDSFCNRVLVKIWPFRFFGLTNLVIARPTPKKPLSNPIVSVIVPARGEAGNIKDIFDRIPDMGLGTELIFVEGGSDDNTYEVIEQEMNSRQPRQPHELI